VERQREVCQIGILEDESCAERLATLGHRTKEYRQLMNDHRNLDRMKSPSIQNSQTGFLAKQRFCYNLNQL
jgi:hypothetical protein